MPRNLQELINKAKGYVLYKIFKNDDNSKISDDECILNQHAQDAFEGKRDLLQKDNCKDPITMGPLLDPVRPIYEDGEESLYVFERSGIEKWIKIQSGKGLGKTDPVNRRLIKELRPDTEYMKPIIVNRLLKCFNDYCNHLSKDERKKVDDALTKLTLRERKDEILVLAIKEGNSELIRSAIKLGADVNATIKPELYENIDVGIPSRFRGVVPLHVAAVNGNTEIAQVLMDNGAEVDAAMYITQGGMRTALYLAVEAQDPEMVKFLLEHGESVDKKVIDSTINSNGEMQNITRRAGCTPLHLAIAVGNLVIAELLIEHGADKNAKIEEDVLGQKGIDAAHYYTPLHIAVAKGNLDAINFLCDHEADINIKGGFHSYTPLHLAIAQGKLDAAGLLCDRGADLNVKNANGYTPLHAAIEQGNLDAVKFLLDNKADVNLICDYGKYTTLELATKKGNSDIVNLIEEAIIKSKIYNPNALKARSFCTML